MSQLFTIPMVTLFLLLIHLYIPVYFFFFVTKTDFYVSQISLLAALGTA